MYIEKYKCTVSFSIEQKVPFFFLSLSKKYFRILFLEFPTRYNNFEAGTIQSESGDSEIRSRLVKHTSR